MLFGSSDTIDFGSSDTLALEANFGKDVIANFSSFETGSTHEVISLLSGEFANFAAVIADSKNSGSNTIITAANGDQLTLAGVNTTTLATLGADFTFHS